MSSDPNCIPETRVDSKGLPKGGACTDSRTGGPGFRNSGGFPPCCDLYSSSDGSSSWMSSRPGSRVPQNLPPQVSQTTQPPVYSLSKAAANCVARNPNYPTLAGSCVYNPLNPCVGNYETTDTRFGTKMCCAPRTASNAACFPPQQSTFKGTRSNFGLGGNTIIIWLFVAIIIFFIGKKYKWF